MASVHRVKDLNRSIRLKHHGISSTYNHVFYPWPDFLKTGIE